MEFLADSYQTLIRFRHQLESGRSLAEIMTELTQKPRQGFETQLTKWWRARMRGSPSPLAASFSVPLHRQFVMAIDRGLKGESILPFLGELDEEMRLSSLDQIEIHLQRLPTLMLLPLMGLIFPSLMLLLMGPIVLELMRSLQ